MPGSPPRHTEFAVLLRNDGVIRVPPGALSAFRGSLPESVVVRVTAQGIDRALRSREVTEREIQTIAQIQREPRENVVRFLLSEGSLAKSRSLTGRVGRGRKRDR
jgi:hypothetical protein